MSDIDRKRVVEAILFAADTPLSLDRLSELVKSCGRSEMREALSDLTREYESGGHAFALAEVAKGFQLYTRPEYAGWIKDLHKGRMSTRLSQAALETLAIVAYKQPIVRTEIEGTRGVDSSGVLSTLLRRNLVGIIGRAPGMGRALMYGTTKEFLRYFGLTAMTDLPRLEEFTEVLGLRPDELELTVEGAESVEVVPVPNEQGGDSRAEAIPAEGGEDRRTNDHAIGDEEILKRLDEA